MIDSGIDIEKSGLKQYVKKSTGFFINDEGYIRESDELKVRHMHGTAVAMVIKHICNNVEFISVNILDEMLSTDGRVLICALEEVISYSPDIIHMSLGTTRWRYRFALQKLVKSAARDGIVLVAAANNEGLKCYPANLKHVIGVKAANINDCRAYFYRDGFFHAPYHMHGIPGAEMAGVYNCRGTSISTAFMTGNIARMITETGRVNPEELLYLLKRSEVSTGNK